MNRMQAGLGAVTLAAVMAAAGCGSRAVDTSELKPEAPDPARITDVSIRRQEGYLRKWEKVTVEEVGNIIKLLNSNPKTEDASLPGLVRQTMLAGSIDPKVLTDFEQFLRANMPSFDWEDKAGALAEAVKPYGGDFCPSGVFLSGTDPDNDVRYRVVQILLDNGAPADWVSACDDYSSGEGIIHIALYKGDARMIELLLQRGANANAEVHYFTPFGHGEGDRYERHGEIITGKERPLDMAEYLLREAGPNDRARYQGIIDVLKKHGARHAPPVPEPELPEGDTLHHLMFL